MISERIVGTKADLRVPDSNGALFPKAAIRSSKFNDSLVRTADSGELVRVGPL
jgi:hypothetical protein